MEPSDPRACETRVAVLAIIAGLARSAEREEWSLAALERVLHPIPALTVSDAVAELTTHGVIAVSRETVSVSPPARYLASLGVLDPG